MKTGLEIYIGVLLDHILPTVEQQKRYHEYMNGKTIPNDYLEIQKEVYSALEYADKKEQDTYSK